MSAIARALFMLVLTLGLFVTPTAGATTITWDLSDVVIGGNRPVAGSFVFDTATNQVLSAYFTTIDPFNGRTDYFDTSAGATVTSTIGSLQFHQSNAEVSADTNGAHTIYLYVDTSLYTAGLGDLVDPTLTLANNSAVATNGCCYSGVGAGSVLENAASIPVPEPASLALFGVGAAMLLGARRRNIAWVRAVLLATVHRGRLTARPVLAALLFTVVATSASAGVINTQTISGYITGGNDTFGLFGGGNLTGDAFSATYTYDTTGFTVTGSGSNYFARGTIAGSMSIAFTVNGDTFNLTSNASYQSDVNYGSPYGSPQGLWFNINDYCGAACNPLRLTLNSNESLESSPFTDPNLDQASTITSGTFQYQYQSNPDEQLNFTVVAAPVPEPASAALFGCSIIGLAFIRRRQRTAMAA